MLVVQVHIRIKPKLVERFKEVTLENVRNSLKEPGIAQFDLLQQQDDPTRFVLTEAYRTPEATAAHKETRHYHVWRETAEPMMAEPRTRVLFTKIGP